MRRQPRRRPRTASHGVAAEGAAARSRRSVGAASALERALQRPSAPAREPQHALARRPVLHEMLDTSRQSPRCAAAQRPRWPRVGSSSLPAPARPHGPNAFSSSVSASAPHASTLAAREGRVRRQAAVGQGQATRLRSSRRSSDCERGCAAQGTVTRSEAGVGLAGNSQLPRSDSDWAWSTVATAVDRVMVAREARTVSTCEPPARHRSEREREREREERARGPAEEQRRAPALRSSSSPSQTCQLGAFLPKAFWRKPEGPRNYWVARLVQLLGL